MGNRFVNQSSELRPLDADEYTIATPENVTFDYQVAGIGSRMIGALIDTLAIVFLLFLLNVLMVAALNSIAALTKYAIREGITQP